MDIDVEDMGPNNELQDKWNDTGQWTTKRVFNATQATVDDWYSKNEYILLHNWTLLMGQKYWVNI